MKKTVLNILLAAMLIFSIDNIYADYSVPCSSSLVSAYGCNTCFRAGNGPENNFIYVGKGKSLNDVVINNGTLRNIYYQDENGSIGVYNTYGAGIVTYNQPQFQYASSFFTRCSGLWCTDPTGSKYTFLNPGDSYKWIETVPGYHLGVVGVNNSLVNDSNRSNIRDNNFTIVYPLKVWFWNVASGTWGGTNTLKECQIIGTHWCGDGVLDSTKGEICDLGGQNGQPGSGCSASCSTVQTVCVAGSVTGPQSTPVVSTTPGLCPSGQTVGNFMNILVGSTFTYSWSCDGASGGNCNASYTPVCTAGSVTGPQDDVITATTPGLCPSGQTVGNFLDSVIGGTHNYTWSCNGISGGNCNATFTPPQVCVAGSVSGPQTDAITATTPGLCPSGQTVGDFLSNTIGGTTFYSWSCNGISGGNCNATFTPPQVCVAGSVTGPQTNPITALTPGLCLVGVVGDFVDTITLGVHHYTWSCNGISGGNCNAEFTPVVPPVCVAGSVTGPQTNPINATTPGLCPSGQAVSGFTDTASGSLHSVTWGCDGIFGGNCNASYSFTSQSCVSGGVTGTQISPITATTPGLCPSGQTVGDFVANNVSGTIFYTWSCNGISGGNCNANLPNGGGVSASCTNLALNGGVSPVTIEKGTTVTFDGTGTNLGANPVYVLTLNNTTNGSVEATLTGTTGSFAYTFNNVAFYNAVLTINTIYGTVGGSNPCARNVTVNNNPPGGGDTWYVCDAADLCGTHYGSQAECLLNNPSPGKGCYHTDEECRIHSPIECAGGGGGGGCVLNNIKEAGEECDGTDVPVGYTCDNTCHMAPITGPGQADCGNGIVERPNRKNFYETCDTPESWCQADCTLTQTFPGENGPGLFKITTQPGGNPMIFNISTYSIIVGDNVSLFGLNDSIGFESSDNVYLGGEPYGIVNNATSHITGAGVSGVFPVGTALGTILYRSGFKVDADGNNILDADGNPVPVYTTATGSHYITLFYGSELSQLKGSTANIIAPDIKWDTNTHEIYPSSGTDNIYVHVGYYEASIPVRVTKNIVANTSGGNAYIYNPVGFDVNAVVGGFIDGLANGNFTTATINKSNRGTNNLSSYTTNYDLMGIVDLNNKLDTTASSELANINNYKTDSIGSSFPVTISNLSDFEHNTEMLGDNSNIYVLKNGDMEILPSATNERLNLTGVKTIVIESGDLIINRDMYYENTIDGNNSSFAFVVKNGDVKISKNVKHISGVYIVLNGKFDTYETTNSLTSLQLIVDGSLYGDVNNLSTNRTFVRGTEASSALTSGIIINYSNRVLKNPPPMLTYFIEQYKQNKVAK